jgi:hypothetical protein
MDRAASMAEVPRRDALPREAERPLLDAQFEYEIACVRGGG